MSNYSNGYVNDLDANLEKRKELIAQIKEISESDNVDLRQVGRIERAWKRIPRWESAYEEELSQEFDSYLSKLNSKRNEFYQANQTKKQEIIADARDLLDHAKEAKATARMNELMDRWKATGSASREIDDVLWQEFREIRKSFFNARHELYEEMKENFGKVKEIKEELIKEAEALKDGENIQKTGEQFRELMTRWKEAGTAGRENDDELWERFNAHRQAFYERQTAYFHEMHQLEKERYQKKQELVAKAQEILDSNNFSKENTQAMKQLHIDWKEVGYCGRRHDEKVWKDFRAVMDKYFEGLRELNEERHNQYINRLGDAKERKMSLINDQQAQITRMEQLKKELLGESAVEEMEAKIEDRKAFIAQLESEIEDIDKTINK